MRIINSAFWVELNVTLKILVFYILSLQSSWHFTFWIVRGSSGRQRNQQRYSCWCLHHVLCRANSNGVLFSRRRPVDNGGHRPADRASGLVLLEQLGYASSVAPVAAARNDEAPLSPRAYSAINADHARRRRRRWPTFAAGRWKLSFLIRQREVRDVGHAVQDPLGAPAPEASRPSAM
jgi:hypothetical protein